MLVSARIGPQTRFVFVHVPKTGGASTRDLFRAALGEAAVWEHGKNFDAHAHPCRIPDSVRLIGGHFLIPQMQALPPDFLYFSVVRDPVDRIVSYYRFILSRPDHPLRPALPHGEINADLATSETFRSHIANQQAQYLSRNAKAASARRLVEEGRLSLATINELDPFLREITMRARIPCHPVRRLNAANGEAPVLRPESLEILQRLTVEDRKLYDFVAAAEGKVAVCDGRTSPEAKGRRPSLARRLWKRVRRRILARSGRDR